MKVLLCLLILTASCSSKNSPYYKFVYEFPKFSAPYNAVTEPDIWFARARFRTLVHIDKNGYLTNDLADKIETTNDKVFIVTLKNNQFFKNGNPIDSTATASAIKEAIKINKSQILRQISEVSILSPQRLQISLVNKNKRFVKELSTHLFGIFDVSNYNNVSGPYYLEKQNILKTWKSSSELPEKVIVSKLDDNTYDNVKNNSFDTFLAYTENFNLKNYEVTYRVQDTWGLVLNLNGMFSDIKFRRSLDSSIDRNQLTQTAFKKHTPTWSLNGNLKSRKQLKTPLTFNILIPNEIGSMGISFCKFMKDIHNISCSFLNFSDLLVRIKSGKFDTALLSLTTDYPFVESSLEYLSPNSNFSIINKEIEIPSKLNTTYGKEFLKELEKYLYEKAYFISLSLPTRTVYASKMDKYIPSLIGPAFDSLENLKR